MSELESWLQETTPHEETVRICFDRNLVSQWEDAVAAHREAKKGMLEAPEDIEARIAELAEKVRDATKIMVFRSIGHRPWRRLLAEHPPSKQQRAEGLDHDPETFVPAAMAATCVVPGMTVEQANRILETQPDLVVDRIWAAVLSANLIGGDEKKVAATVVPPATAKR